MPNDRPTLPISLSLREAAPESVSDLFSRDVEGMEDSDIDRIIADQRANRARLETAELAGQKPPRAKTPKVAINTPKDKYQALDDPFLEV